jgi:hypothetical protein
MSYLHPSDVPGQPGRPDILDWALPQVGEPRDARMYSDPHTYWDHQVQDQYIALATDHRQRMLAQGVPAGVATVTSGASIAASPARPSIPKTVSWADLPGQPSPDHPVGSFALGYAVLGAVAVLAVAMAAALLIVAWNAVPG